MASLRPCNHLMAMSDFDDREGADGLSARPGEERLPPARPEPRPGEAEVRRSGAGRSRPPRPVKPGVEERHKPTPVRATAVVESLPEPVDPDLDHATIVVEGQEWVIRVVGRAGGSGLSATPLLLLGFWPRGDAERAHAREALVVARALAELSTEQLEMAFGASVTPTTPLSPADRVREAAPGRKRGARKGRDGAR